MWFAWIEFANMCAQKTSEDCTHASKFEDFLGEIFLKFFWEWPNVRQESPITGAHMRFGVVSFGSLRAGSLERSGRTAQRVEPLSGRHNHGLRS